MKVDHHDHARLHGNSKQGDVTHPDCYAEVVSKQPLEDQSSGHRIECREDEHYGFGDVMENQVQEKENHKKDDWQNDLEALLGPKFKLVLTRPGVDVSRRQRKFLAQ